MNRAAQVTLCACLLTGTAFANQGDLDSTFGQNGIARITLPTSSTINAVAIQPDGKLVAVGNYTTSTSMSYLSDFIVVRLNSDGTPDTSFDGDGIKTFGFGSLSEVAMAVTITPDNKILIGGVTYGRNVPVFGEGTLTRLNSDGTLDTSFGVAGVSYLSHSTGTIIGAIVRLPDGKLLLGGNTDNTQGVGDLIVFRTSSNGFIDSSFGTSGRTTIDVDQYGENFSGLALVPDGRIVIAGTGSKSAIRQMTVARLLSNGQLDMSTPPGKFAFNVGLRDTVNRISLQSDGKLILASHLDSGYTFRGLGMIVRLNSDGTRDQSFGSNGRIVRVPSASAVTTDSSGHVYFVGEPLDQSHEPTPGRSTVHALDVDGSALSNFGRGGKTIVDMGSGAQASSAKSFAIERLSDGRLLVFGQNGNYELIVTRLLASGGHAGVLSILPVLSSPTIGESAGSVSFYVIRTGGSTGAVTVNYATSSATATAGTDYTPTSGTLSWADGDVTTKTITLPLIDDNDYEAAAEIISMTLSAPTGGAKIGTAVQNVSVTSDEQPSTIQFVTGSVVLANAQNLRIPVERRGDTRVRSTIDYTTRAITAVAGTDFQPTSGTLVWEPWDNADKIITVPILDDSVNNNTTKRLAIDLSNASTGTSTSYPGSVEAEIRPYTNGGGISFDQTYVVATESSGTLSLTVRPTYPLNAPLTLNVTTGPYSFIPPTAGSDFVTPTQSISWAANDVSPRTVTFTLLDDAVAEGTEIVEVFLTAPQGNYATTRVVILDDDPISAASQIQLNTSAITASESVGATSVTVTRTGSLATAASAQWRIVYGTADSADIFVPVNSPTLNWAAGDGANKTISIPIIRDALAEPDETFTVQLFNPQGGASLGGTSAAAITISEAVSGTGPTVQFAQSAVTVSEDDEYVDLPLVHSLGNNNSAYYYSLSAVPGSVADLDSEFTLSPEESFLGFFGNSPTSAMIRLYLNGDSKIEGNETFSVLLRGRPNEPQIGPTNTATITLVSNDVVQVPVELSVSPTSVSVAESAGTISIVINRTGSTTSPVSVNYQTIAGTSMADTDFVATSGTLTWAIGDGSSKTIAIPLINDTIVESAEQFTLQLSSATNATIAIGTVSISITDDDTVTPTPTTGGTPSGGSGSSNGSSGGGGGGSLDFGFLLALLALLGGVTTIRNFKLTGRLVRSLQ